MKQIRDDSPTQGGSYFRLVFCRSKRTADLPFLSWLWITIVEILLGEELIEQLTITSAYTEDPSAKHGQFLHLNDLVPYGLLTNRLRSSVRQIFYYKYHKQYYFLCHEAEPEIGEDEINVTNSRFAVPHESLHRLISFRRVYIVVAVTFNALISLVVFFFADLVIALLTSLAVEGFRRLSRI